MQTLDKGCSGLDVKLEKLSTNSSGLLKIGVGLLQFHTFVSFNHINVAYGKTIKNTVNVARVIFFTLASICLIAPGIVAQKASYSFLAIFAFLYAINLVLKLLCEGLLGGCDRQLLAVYRAKD